MSYETLRYEVDGAIATITFDRPERLNTIVPPLPDELEQAVDAAVADREVRVIVVRGAGRSFCAGFDFGGGFHDYDEILTTNGRWDPGKDFVFAPAPSIAPVPKFMSMWRAPKPVIAQVHGWCVGGGSDMAVGAATKPLIAQVHGWCVGGASDMAAVPARRIGRAAAPLGTPAGRMGGCY